MMKFSLNRFFNESVESVLRFIARHTPKRLRYFVVIQVWADATTKHHTDKSPDEVSWSMALDTLDSR